MKARKEMKAAKQDKPSGRNNPRASGRRSNRNDMRNNAAVAR
jgi:hypothetical protein